MGRYPFAVVASNYLHALEDHRARTTLVQLKRDLNTIRTDVEALAGRLTTTDPARMSVDDLAVILGHWRVRPKRGPNARFTEGTLDPTSQTHLWRALKGLLQFAGNGAVGQLKTLPYVEPPTVLEKPIDTLSEEDFQRLRAAAETIPGFRGKVARFVLDFCVGTGLRPKEIRLQELGCVDLLRGEGIVCHPKGEGKYAVAHRDPFPLTALAEHALRDFLPEREAYLDGQEHPALIPTRSQGGTQVMYWPDSSFRKLMADLRKASGVKVNLQELRATFGQRAIDRRVDPQDVSRAMRHKTTVTTERYYARVRPKDALARLKQAFSERAVTAK